MQTYPKTDNKNRKKRCDGPITSIAHFAAVNCTFTEVMQNVQTMFGRRLTLLLWSFVLKNPQRTGCFQTNTWPRSYQILQRYNIIITRNPVTSVQFWIIGVGPRRTLFWRYSASVVKSIFRNFGGINLCIPQKPILSNYILHAWQRRVNLCSLYACR